MKKLTEYSKNGYHWKVIMRIGDVAMSQADERSYEVFWVQSHNGRVIAGNEVPPSEYPPSNEQWGSLGWSYSKREDADERFQLEANLQLNPLP